MSNDEHCSLIFNDFEKLKLFVFMIHGIFVNNYQ